MAKGKTGEFIRPRRKKTRKGGGAVRSVGPSKEQVLKAQKITQRYMA